MANFASVNSKNCIYLKISASLKESDILDAISEYIASPDIVGIDVFDGVAIVYLSSFHDVKRLIMEGVTIKNVNYEVFYLYDVYNIYGVPLLVNNDKLSEVLSVTSTPIVFAEMLPLCPNIPEYSHVLGSNRRIYVENDKWNISCPFKKTINWRGNYAAITVEEYCMLCETEKHNTNECKLRWQGIVDSTHNNENSCMHIPEEAFQLIEFDLSNFNTKELDNMPELSAVPCTNDETQTESNLMSSSLKVINKSSFEVSKPDLANKALDIGDYNSSVLNTSTKKPEKNINCALTRSKKEHNEYPRRMLRKKFTITSNIFLENFKLTNSKTLQGVPYMQCNRCNMMIARYVRRLHFHVKQCTKNKV